MPTTREALRELNLGSSVAEFDQQLEMYFVETQPFLDLIDGRRDIIAGDKGTGKTAIFKILHRRYSSIPQLRNTIVVPAFNLSGNPIFQQLAERGILDEPEYNRFWKAYILSIVGNWLLRTNKYKPRSKLHALDILLRGLELRSDADGVKTVFDKVVARIGYLFDWKSMEFAINVTESGYSFTPKVELGKSDNVSVKVPIERCLSLLDDCLREVGKKVWVALDRLDESFEGFPEAEIPALRALLRTYLDLEEFENITVKLFIRRDLFSRVVKGGFVNLTHINARKIELRWDEDDLKTLLCRRIKQNETFCRFVGCHRDDNDGIFARVFPTQVDQGTRKPATWAWMMSRISDGNGVKPPRNLIDLVSFAREAQLRREDRSPREIDGNNEIIEADSLRMALTQLSETRVTDTLLAEAKGEVPLIEKFRRSKAEHNQSSLARLLSVKKDSVIDKIRPLIHLGLLGEVGSNYKVPILYRSGLEITQGKAAGVTAVQEADNDDE
ncbi:conserved hypothetical protein [Sphingomonas sp. EC-HK361]|uniref:P-loop ATPase, Sll1717 family n=1 Tax=Sphingomonas sp. EC-HK361 TaxID=2038397 RepID=UPI001253851C|nr:hypothetical protein [Sphingomonas sp. EC-HK361]VVT13361.1 conserved hypothetical protein [Sphingomonas sp. EC-HK361]